MSEDRIKELEAELARTRSLLDERNRISGNLMLQLKEIAGAVFQDYLDERDYAQLVAAVRSLAERQAPVPFMVALQHWLDAMERRSTTSITRADTRLAGQARDWFSQTAEKLRLAELKQRVEVQLPTLEQLRHGWDSTQGEQKPWQWAHELICEYVVSSGVAAFVGLLNRAMEHDRTAMASLVKHQVVSQGSEIGLLGLVNRILGTRDTAKVWIAAIYSEDGELLRFEARDPVRTASRCATFTTGGDVPSGVYVAVALLNRALKHDPKAMFELVEHRVAVTEAMVKDETIQCVRVDGLKKAGHEVGLLGIINGIYGTRKDGQGWIAARFGDDGASLLEFVVNKPKDQPA